MLVVSAGCGVAEVRSHPAAGPDASVASVATDGGRDAGAEPDAGDERLPDAGTPPPPDASVDGLTHHGVVNPACPDDLASIVDVQLPARMDTNSLRYATVTVANTGASAWSEDDAVRLGSPGDEDPFAANARVVLPGGVQVASTQTVTWRVPLRAPAQPGTYLTDWQMVREGVCWFGDRVTRSIAVAAPVATGQCVDPAPSHLDTLAAVIHIIGPTRTTLDSTPKVCDREYCAMIGFTDGRGCCPPRPEGHPDVDPCNEALVGRASDTGRVGPTWTFNGERCGPDGPGNCQNHPDNQFLLWVFGPGTARACGNLNGVCGEVVVP